MVIIKGHSTKIDEQYSLHIAEKDNKQEFQQILELNVKVHGEPVRGYLERVYNDHPRRDSLYSFYVKDNIVDQIISGLILMPLEWSFGGKILSICEMGFVGTLEEYRGKGFITLLNEKYEQLMAEKGYIISVIRGIPYFYRKLGYEYAIPLDHRIKFSISAIPLEKLQTLNIRKANPNDLKFISEKYREFHKNFFISNKFDEDEYLLKFINDNYNDFKTSTLLISENGIPVGYFTFGRSYDDLGYDIKHSKINHEMCVKILQFVKNTHKSEIETEIIIAIREETELSDFLIKLGGISYNTYGWQVKIPNLKLYLEELKPILEKRVRDSKFNGLTQKVKISNYEEIIELYFKYGILSSVNTVKEYPEEGSCDIRIPEPFIFKLLLGDKSMEELNYIIKDAMIIYNSKNLIDALFPKMKSFGDSYY